jgi:threonine synthase
MKYTSTRNNNTSVSGSEAIVNGISNDGGLYVPSSFPNLQPEDFNKLLV